jgi:hypothetical protein
LNRNTLQLIFSIAIAYAVLLVLIRGSLPVNSAPAISITGIPLIVIVFIIAQDLVRRSTRPTNTPKSARHQGPGGRSVQLLSGHIRVAANASESYFDTVIRAHLKELLTTKASIETGVDYEKVRGILSNPETGPELLHDPGLYQLLYGHAPQKGPARIRMIEEALDLIGAWKS